MHLHLAVRLLGDKKYRAMAKSIISILGFIVLAFIAALVLVAVEGPHELEVRVAAKAEWRRRTALRNESIQMLASVLANHAEALGNLSIISEELLHHVGPEPLVEEANSRWDWTFPGALYFVFTVVTTIGCACMASNAIHNAPRLFPSIAHSS